MITGRSLGPDGRPIDGTGFEYQEGSLIADLLARRVSPVYSQPITKEWVFALVTRNQANGEYERGVGVFTPGNSGPPEHIHPTYEERFEFIQGEFIFRLDGKERKVGAGEKFVVPIGSPHTFRCIGDIPGAVIVETWPAARTGEVISTLFGMAHDGLLTPQGQPRFLHGIVIGSEYSDDTVFTNPPPNIAIPMAKALAPIARMMGYRSTYPKYFEESFWDAHVEQPPRAMGASAVEIGSLEATPAAVDFINVNAAMDA